MIASFAEKVFARAPSVALGALVCVALGGCDDKSAGPPAGTPPPPVARAAQQASVDAGLSSAIAVHGPEVTENDFVESDRNRDPFRSYATIFVERGAKPVANQRQVILGQYSIDELKLVALVTGSEQARAMLVDPGGKGWVLKRGDYVGRPDVVHTGGTNGTDYQLNWRIDRIRDGDLVLLRDDPAQPGVPPATRVIPLHPEAEKQEHLDSL
jgi:type IV pilus assembly protein PilP